MSLRTAKIITIVVMISTASLWIGWDIVVAALGLYPATESRLLLAFGSVNVAFPSALGGLLGHLFWPMKGAVRFRLARICVLAGYMTCLIVLNVLHAIPPIVPILPLVAHIPVGHFLWPQTQPEVRSKTV